MLAGVSGLNANSSAMAVISDNIANVNTTAYKSDRSDFEDLVNAQSSRTTYNAGGTRAVTRQLISSQGNIASTTSTTDIAIQGDGFFVVSPMTDIDSSSAEISYTRNGTFYPDEEGYLVNSASNVLRGWPLDSEGNVSGSTTSISALVPVNINGISDSVNQSTNVALTGNLDSDTEVSAAVTAGTYVAGNMASGTVTADTTWPIQVVDSLGGTKTLNVSLLKSATANQWYVEVYSSPASNVTGANGLVTSGTLAFTTSGEIDTANTTAGLLAPISIPWAASTGLAAQSVQLELGQTATSTGAITQHADDTSLTSTTTDGTTASKLDSLSIDEEGYVTAIFKSGAKKKIFQIPLVTFTNSDGLKKYSGGVYKATQQSGDPTLQAAGSGRAGTLESSALEASTVDLAREFSNMIITQRAYSASSKIITTADEMLNELISMKR
jgi:flagellar hook protein FlgE